MGRLGKYLQQGALSKQMQPLRGLSISSEGNEGRGEWERGIPSQTLSIFTVNLEPCPCEPQKFSLKKQLSFTALKKKSVWGGTSLNVQWLRLHAPNPEGPGSIPGQGTRSCVPQLRSGTSQVVFLVAQRVRNLPAGAGDTGSIPGLGKTPGEGNGNPLQYSCLENPMDRSLRGSSLWGRKESDTA